MDTVKPKALRLAQRLYDDTALPEWVEEAAEELRRLHTENEAKEALLRQALEALKLGCPPDCKDGMTDSGGVYPWGEAVLIPCPSCSTIAALRERLGEMT